MRILTDLREPAMSTEANTTQLQRLADEVLTGHNLAALDEIFHADYVEHEPPPEMGPGATDSGSGWEAGLRRSRRAMDNRGTDRRRPDPRARAAASIKLGYTRER
jgi:hypothetical protein